MKLVIQRVKKAAVWIDGRETASIGPGLLVLVGIEKGDNAEQAELLAKKTAGLRIFGDENGKSNLSAVDIGGEILAVSQFTLAADLRKGNRPSFDTAEDPEKAKILIAHYIRLLREAGLPVKEGQFGAHMQVELVNDGPVTYLL